MHGYVDGDLYSRVPWEPSTWRHSYYDVVCVGCAPCQRDQIKPTPCDQLPVLLVFGEGGMNPDAEARAAYFTSRPRECVRARSKTASSWSSGCQGRPSYLEESCQDHDGHRNSRLFIGVSSLERPAREGHRRPVGGGIGAPVSTEAAASLCRTKVSCNSVLQRINFIQEPISSSMLSCCWLWLRYDGFETRRISTIICNSY